VDGRRDCRFDRHPGLSAIRTAGVGRQRSQWGPNPRGGWGIGFFRGILLWQGEFYEESGIPELKHSWRTGEWLQVHRYFRETLVLVGLPLLLLGVFGTVALVIDVTAVRLLLVLALAYALARLGFALIRA
jgi:hypothetical protein